MGAIKYSSSDIYSKTREETVAAFNSDPSAGLTETEAAKRLAEFGKNSIKEKEPESPLIILLGQFKGPFVLLLFFAAALSFYFKEWLDGVAILVVIVINAVIGFLMEYQAERSMEALKRLAKVNAKVIRSGKLVEILSDEIVPGDILFAEAGDIILADARIYSLSQLQVDESSLTGESIAVDKEEKTLPGNVPLAERVNMIYKGTFVSKGNVTAVVTGTGMQTELGKIADMVQSAEQTTTPLEKKIEQFSKKILWLTVVLIVIIFLAGVLEGDNIVEMLQTSIALAVAAIPEGLPIVTTLALAQGMLRMAKHNVIVKKLSAVETLGGTNVICTDKTGTLTQNRIAVNTIAFPGTTFEIQPVHEDESPIGTHQHQLQTSGNYQMIMRIAVLCNTAELVVKNNAVTELGDPLETGLLKFVHNQKIEIDSFRHQFPKVHEEPFSSDTRIMATLHKTEQNYFTAAKGSVEELLNRCTRILIEGNILPIDEEIKSHWLCEAEQLAHSGLRVIAAAYNETQNVPEVLSQDLVFAGLIGLLDPPRQEVFDAIRECKSAGIKVVMITGDHPATAKNIALKLGLLENENEEVLHGKEMADFETLSTSEKQRWLNARIFARVSPKQKLDLVKVHQENKGIVGMTGDGVNDAPALKKADIGIAMGQRGTQVAQQVADMILKDDSFSSIVLAIKQGRTIFENIRKFVIYLLSCNLSELLIISFSSIMSLHYALFPLQILYINLVTDVLPALALGVTEGSSSIMREPPRNSTEQIIDRKRWKSIIIYSIVISASCLAAVFVSHETVHKEELWNPELCNNVLFITLILSQLWHVFNMTTDNAIPLHKSDVFRNKYVWYAMGICLILTIGAFLITPVAEVLSLYRPSMKDLATMLGFSLLSLLVIQIMKRMRVVL